MKETLRTPQKKPDNFSRDLIQFEDFLKQRLKKTLTVLEMLEQTNKDNPAIIALAVQAVTLEECLNVFQQSFSSKQHGK